MRALRLVCMLFLCTPWVIAQRHSTAISAGEEEKIRDAAADPALRVTVFQQIIETRIQRMQGILVDKRAQGRREDLKQNMDEITGLIDEFQDNLEDYDHAHRDLRKPLPKLLTAIDRWQSVLKQPPVDDSYEVTRKLALEAVADVRQQAAEMIPAQTVYFKAHPPDTNANPGGIGDIKHE